MTVLFNMPKLKMIERRTHEKNVEKVKACCPEFLKTVPKKYRMYLEQGLETAEFMQADQAGRAGLTKVKEKDIRDMVFSYGRNSDLILYNPQNIRFNNIDIRIAITHELSHRIDIMFGESQNNQVFSEAIKKFKEKIMNNRQIFKKFCRVNDRDGFLSDICSALTGSKVKFTYRHEKKYWRKEGNKEIEIFPIYFVWKPCRMKPS